MQALVLKCRNVPLAPDFFCTAEIVFETVPAHRKVPRHEELHFPPVNAQLLIVFAESSGSQW